jgi:hypothetical protein
MVARDVCHHSVNVFNGFHGIIMSLSQYDTNKNYCNASSDAIATIGTTVATIGYEQHTRASDSVSARTQRAPSEKA